jgi:hypothetical protein
LAGALLFDEKIRQSSGLDCGMMEFFTHKPQSQEHLFTPRIFGARFGGKDRGLWPIKPVIPTKRTIRGILV